MQLQNRFLGNQVGLLNLFTSLFFSLIPLVI